MRYLSLDQALSLSGYAIFDNAVLIAYGTFKTKGAAQIGERLGSIWRELNNLYAEYEFTEVFFEDCYKQPNISTYQKLSMVKATVLLWCYFEGIPCSCSEPSHWRKILGNEFGLKFPRTRTEQKQRAIQFVSEHFNKDVTSDEADAICIGCAGYIEKSKNKSDF